MIKKILGLAPTKEKNGIGFFFLPLEECLRISKTSEKTHHKASIEHSQTAIHSYISAVHRNNRANPRKSINKSRN